MSANHALFFVFNGPREGKEAQMMENNNAMRAYWTKKKQAGEIDSVETVMLASSGNVHMPAGFTLVTGDRAKLHKIRWDEAEFLNLHTVAMVTTQGYACVDGYAGEEFNKHVQRLQSLIGKK
jgi:hypothetical protein